MPSIARTKELSSEVMEELKKVTWPDRPQLKNITMVVIVFVVIVSLIIWAMDLAVSAVLNGIISIFTAA